MDLRIRIARQNQFWTSYFYMIGFLKSPFWSWELVSNYWTYNEFSCCFLTSNLWLGVLKNPSAARASAQSAKRKLRWVHTSPGVSVETEHWPKFLKKKARKSDLDSNSHGTDLGILLDHNLISSQQCDIISKTGCMSPGGLWKKLSFQLTFWFEWSNPRAYYKMCYIYNLEASHGDHNSRIIVKEK